MKKNLVLFLILTLLLTLTGCTSENKEKTDAIKFKEEYESINGIVNEKSGKENRTLTIDKENPFIYSTAEEISKKMDNNETFIVYFGFKECPWCRSVLEELISAAKDKNVEKIYYVDVKEIRDVKEIDEEGNIKTTKEGSEGYNQLIEKMNDVLEEYKLKKDDEEIEVGEKRIYAPNVVAVSDGKAIQLETGISEKQKDGYQKLTDKMKKETYNKFKCLITCLEEASTTCQKDMC
jgi:thiol-disulfide isomerase/thioredoxin